MIIRNPDQELYEAVTAAVKANDGYCPCSLTHTPDDKCMCADFRLRVAEGECQCGRYIKIKE